MDIRKELIEISKLIKDDKFCVDFAIYQDRVDKFIKKLEMYQDYYRLIKDLKHYSIWKNPEHYTTRSFKEVILELEDKIIRKPKATYKIFINKKDKDKLEQLLKENKFNLFTIEEEEDDIE